MSRKVDEQEIIAGCMRGEAQARKLLYEQYAPAMMSVCVRYAGNKDTARDLLQEGFIKVYTKIHSFTASGSFEGWMKKIFVTTALEFLRQNNSLKLNTNVEEYADLADEKGLNIVEKLTADELFKCIAELPDGYRTIFNLYAIEGYSHVEIAQILHIKESSSRSQFGRARSLLQKKIRDLYSYK